MLDSKNGIIGLAIGDAMGVPLEFHTREELMRNITKEMKGYGSHNVPKGCWSDDTSMTLATVDSLNQQKKIDTEDIASKFLAWFRKAEYTPTGKVFDIGGTTLKALAKYELKLDKAVNCGQGSEMDNGNGSLMRILPLIYYCYSKNFNEEETYQLVKTVSSITHKHEISIMGCYMYVLFGMKLLEGAALEEAYTKIKATDYSKFSQDCMSRYDRIIKNDISKYDMDEIKSSGYIVDTLEATLWTLLTTDNYNDAIIRAINLGHDTDTIGACVGGIAGIYYGLDSIENAWKEDLVKYNYIQDLCNEFNEILN